MHIFKGLRVVSLPLIASLFFAACFHDTGAEKNNAAPFDIPAYIKKQSDLLSSSDIMLRKSVTWSGTTQDTLIKDPDWNTELGLFTEKELSPKMLSGNIAADSLNGGIIYRAMDADSKFRSAFIRTEAAGANDSIAVETARAGIYGNEYSLLQFHSRRGYTIQVRNHPAAGKETELFIEGTFVRQEQ